MNEPDRMLNQTGPSLARALQPMSLGRIATPIACLGAALGFIPACGSTLDSLGCGERHAADGGSGFNGSVTLTALVSPGSYPNAFRDLLSKSDNDIANKLADTFDQLFHGDPTNEAIFVPVGTDQAYISDVLHNEIRTEGIGMGMMVSVELDKRDEFDRLWRYAKSTLQVPDGADQGYFRSYCYNGSTDYVCNEPFGLEQFATSLLLARGRWQSSPGAIDYGQDASNLLDLIRNKEAYNCGIADGVTGVFDSESKLVYNTPTATSANTSRPSIVTPAYYDLWQQATGDPFWGQAAAAARNYWQASANPTTGLIPEEATFDGKSVAGFETFQPECDRAFFNMALDHLWSGTQGWLVDESNRLLQFFYQQGLTSYGQAYSLDGTSEIVSFHDAALIAANGTLALVASTNRRGDFVNEVWNLTTPTGTSRYYPGIMQLFALVMLSGQMRVY